MKTATDNLEYHLSQLKDLLSHPTDFDVAMRYFMDKFACDLKFHARCHPEDVGHLQSLLGYLASKMLRRCVQPRDVQVFHLPGHQFFHGKARLEKNFLVFIYFQSINLGLVTHVNFRTRQERMARWQIPPTQTRHHQHN